MPDTSLSDRELPERVEDLICFALYSTSHAISRAYAPLLKPLGLTYPQYITLTVLRDEDGQGVGALSKALRMESSTLTPLIKRLEAQGFVRRNRGEKDERQVFVYLTKPGRDVLKAAPNITKCMIEDTGLDHARLVELVQVLTKLSDNMQGNRNTGKE